MGLDYKRVNMVNLLKLASFHISSLQHSALLQHSAVLLVSNSALQHSPVSAVLLVTLHSPAPLRFFIVVEETNLHKYKSVYIHRISKTVHMSVDSFS
jgi:hypothetical protein